MRGLEREREREREMIRRVGREGYDSVIDRHVQLPSSLCISAHPE